MMDRLLLPIAGLVIVGIIAAAVYNGLPTHRDGKVGDTLQAHAISARLVDVDHPKSGHGYFTTPAHGTHFVGMDIGLCNKGGGSTGPWDWKLELSGGSEIGTWPHPQGLYRSDLDGSDEGCSRGWLVFAVPDGRTPKALHYRYDGYNGDSQTTYHHSSEDTQEHDRFTWKL